MKSKTGKGLGSKFYAGGDSEVAAESKAGTDGFKRGGKAKKKMVGSVEGIMSAANAGRKPRKSGGGVFSSAASGTPRAKSSHY